VNEDAANAVEQEPAAAGAATEDAPGNRPEEATSSGPGEGSGAEAGEGTGPLSEATAAVAPAEVRVAELEEAYRRLAADFLNYRRRMEREQAQWSQAARGELLLSLLDVFDILELAGASAERPETQVADLKSGLEMVLRRLWETLAQVGVERIGQVGMAFDPNTCEALGEEEVSGAAPGTVTAVVRTGYRMGERLLRPAWVRVAAHADAAARPPATQA